MHALHLGAESRASVNAATLSYSLVSDAVLRREKKKIYHPPEENLNLRFSRFIAKNIIE